jgi:predicted RNase H-like nuclease (RuvC/YqgF family)
MINNVKKQISQITAQYNMKQQEEAKLVNEERIIKEKQAQIEDLKQKLQDTKENLAKKQQEQDQLKKFNDFLDSIVQDRGKDAAGGGSGAGETKEFDDIEAL